MSGQFVIIETIMIILTIVIFTSDHQRLDLDEDGEVTVEEFLQACTQDKTIR